MSQFKIRLGYIGFTLLAILFFMVVLFPVEKAQRYLKHYVNTLHKDVQINFDSLALKLPSGIELDPLQVKFKNKEVIQAQRIRLSYGLLSLFSSGNTVYFDSQMLKGRIDGKIDLSRSSTKIAVVLAANLDQIRIEELPMVQDHTQYGLAGALSGRIDYRMVQTPQTVDDRGEAALKLKDASCEFLAPPFDVIEPIVFDSIEAKFKKEKQTITIESIKAGGRQVQATVTGKVQQRRPITASQLDLTVNLTIDPLFMSKLKKIPTINMLIGNKRINSFAFNVRGTVAKPLPLPK